MSESGHHARHRRLDHKLSGTNYGRNRKRGEASAASRAALDQEAYMRLWLRWVHWVNCRQSVPHLLTQEMLRDKVPPYRMSIYRWAERRGLIQPPSMDMAYLRAHLLPTYRATARRDGLHLHRPGTGERVELLANARFSSDELFHYPEMRAALVAKPPHIDVKLDPDDLSKVYVSTSKGPLEIPNVSADRLTVQVASVADLSAMLDAEKENRIKNRTDDEQAQSELMGHIAEENRLGQQKKAEVLDPTKKRPKATPEGVRQARQREEAEQLQRAADRAAQPPQLGVDDSAKSLAIEGTRAAPTRPTTEPPLTQGDASLPARGKASNAPHDEADLTRDLLDSFWRALEVGK